MLSLRDWIVVGLYIAGLVGFGVFAARKAQRPEDYFLASRASRWPSIGLALLASNISSTALIGLAGAGYAVGISVYNYEWTAVVALVFFCIFLLPFILKSRVYTMPEYLERRYDRRARLYFTALTLFLNIFVDSAGVLYSGSLVCRLIFPETPLWQIVLVLAGLAGIYTTLGGLRAVIWTETVQSLVLFVGALAIAIAAFAKAGGWHAVMTGVPASHLSLIRPVGDPSVPWPGLVFGVPLLGFYYWCTNQFIVQRVISAKNLDHGRWGALFAGLLKLPILFLMVLPGTAASLFLPGLPRGDMVYPALILTILPAGVTGLVVASFIAATMVSIASTLNSSSMLITMDLVKPLRPGTPPLHLVWIGRIATATLLAFAVIWAPHVENFPSLWQYLQSVLAYAVPPIVALFLVGLFWPGANSTGATATLVVGSVLGLALFLGDVVFHAVPLHFLYAAPILTAIDTAILVGVSCLTGRAETNSLVWTREFYRAESERLATLPVWQNYRVLSVALVAVTAALVWVFR